MGSRRSRPRKQKKPQYRRYLVVTEGVTEREYLERLRQRIRSRHVALDIKVGGGEPSRVLKECRKALRAEKYDGAVIVVDVDQHDALDAVLTECRSSGITAIVTNPCFELWLLWHSEDHHAHINPKKAGERLKSHKHGSGRDGKHLAKDFPIDGHTAAADRAHRAWNGLAVNERAPIPLPQCPG